MGITRRVVVKSPKVSFLNLASESQVAADEFLGTLFSPSLGLPVLFSRCRAGARSLVDVVLGHLVYFATIGEVFASHKCGDGVGER